MKETFIHSLACIENAKLGEGVRVYQFASVVRGAKIGARTVIGPGACIDGSEIGEDCRVGAGFHMGPGFRVGNGVFLGPYAVLCNDAWPRAHKEGFDIERLENGYAVIIEDGASLGVRATVLPGVRIGKRAMVAAGATVTRDVLDDHIWTREGVMKPIGDERRRARIVLAVNELNL